MNPPWELYEMFEAFLQAPTYHVTLELILTLLVLWLLFHKSYKPQRTELTEKEKEQLIEEWTPQSLIPEELELEIPHFGFRQVKGKMGVNISVDDKIVLNMASHNYLGLAENPKLEEAAIACLRKYGVGSCGPRGFYGTVDIHLELEQKLANFLHVEEAVLYSYGFSTMSSAIPAYSKQGDVIFCDSGVNLAVQKGLLGSRSKVHFFKHNDMKDLERLLEVQDQMDKANPKKAKVTRRFLVVEAIYINYGDICPLPEVIELKNRYKVRLFIDETCSFGVLGETGRGITEHFNIPMTEIDLIGSTLEGAIPSYGGFICGTSFIVDHQRLSGLGYCFSASLPPMQAGVAIAALDILEANPGIVNTLQTNCKKMHELLTSIPQIDLHSDPLSPVKHLILSNDLDVSMKSLNEIVDYTMEQGVAVTVARYIIKEEYLLPPPSIRLIVSAALAESDIIRVGKILRDAFDHVIK